MADITRLSAAFEIKSICCTLLSHDFLLERKFILLTSLQDNEAVYIKKKKDKILWKRFALCIT